jgi:4-alpha-glucanotransferase
MREGRIYGNKLLYFEREFDGRFRHPSQQQADTLLMVTNHDVPTLADWWSGDDLRRRHRLGLLVEEHELQRQLGTRQHDKRQLLDWLQGLQLLPGDRIENALEKDLDLGLCEAIHRACARSAARLLLLQLEDLQLLREPVNIPGTHREYSNWRRKQSVMTAQLFAQPAIQQLLHAVDEERRQ